jgi:glycosyltransferase involved in cell wall biosynthesis
VAGAAVLFADPDTPGALAEAIMQALSRSPAEREAIIAAGRRQAAAFTWQRTAGIVYDTLLSTLVR